MKLDEKILRDAYGNITIHVEGDLNFNHGDPLKNAVQDLFSDNPYADLTLDLTKVELVGSTGVCHFVDTIKYFQERLDGQRLLLSNVSPHLKKLFGVYKLDANCLYTDFGMDDDDTTNLNQKFGNRKRTYEN